MIWSTAAASPLASSLRKASSLGACQRPVRGSRRPPVGEHRLRGVGRPFGDRRPAADQDRRGRYRQDSGVSMADPAWPPRVGNPRKQLQRPAAVTGSDSNLVTRDSTGRQHRWRGGLAGQRCSMVRGGFPTSAIVAASRAAAQWCSRGARRALQASPAGLRRGRRDGRRPR